MKKIIGIISYLPDNEEIREIRVEKLRSLISKCDELFNLPIMIVAQNWKDENIGSKNCEIYDYPKLGIVGARRKLRQLFLNSGVDILIMLDDDCHISGTRQDAYVYLNEIDEHGESFGEFRGTQLKLFSIHRNIYSKVDFSDVSPELGEGFEDTIFVEKLRKNFADKRFTFSKTNNYTKLYEDSRGATDENSTWYSNQNLEDMLEKTRGIINE